ncbi:unnamed protein product [Protopolystoma xenopodis]|uniref:Uncharacterized protein n=1 Tax=Protopolystoma xenopodis TaxID=117903 RepID=A0A448X1F3_9PLAT|nr:unnamed protein product [Protopolystoma xenopodis]
MAAKSAALDAERKLLAAKLAVLAATTKPNIGSRTLEGGLTLTIAPDPAVLSYGPSASSETPLRTDIATPAVLPAPLVDLPDFNLGPPFEFITRLQSMIANSALSATGDVLTRGRTNLPLQAQQPHPPPPQPFAQTKASESSEVVSSGPVTGFSNGWASVVRHSGSLDCSNNCPTSGPLEFELSSGMTSSASIIYAEPIVPTSSTKSTELSTTSPESADALGGGSECDSGDPTGLHSAPDEALSHAKKKKRKRQKSHQLFAQAETSAPTNASSENDRKLMQSSPSKGDVTPQYLPSDRCE